MFLSAKSFMKDLADCFTTENVHIAKDSEQYCFKLLLAVCRPLARPHSSIRLASQLFIYIAMLDMYALKHATYLKDL